MSLKDKILQRQTEARCINCENFEIINGKVPYCNKTDKLILEMHVDVVRKCSNFCHKKGE